jgi:serine/threonine protein kinase
MGYLSLTIKQLIDECNSRVDEYGNIRISDCTGENKNDIIKRLIDDDFLYSEKTCYNEKNLQSGFVNEKSHLIYYTDGKLTYCFGVGDLEYLYESKLNPFTQTPLTKTFLEWLEKFLQTDIYKRWLSELHKEDINQKKDTIDNVLQQGLYLTNIESKKSKDPYINVDHFLELIKENSEYSLLPNEVNLSSNDSIINYLYNNINIFITKDFDEYSVIYMIVKYAYNKEIIENEKESNENKEFAESWNKKFKDLIEKLYSIDRIFIEIKRSHELAKKHMNLFFEAIMRGRVDILEIMRRYLPKKISKEIINKTFRVAAKKGHIEVLEWLTKVFNITEEDYNEAFLLAAGNGHLKVLKWLKENFNITKEYVKSNYNLVFKYAAEQGHLEILKWLKEEFNITKEDATSDRNATFINVAENGNLKVLEWLTKTFDITEHEAKINDNYAFRMAAKEGHLNVLKWLTKTFNITEQEAKINNNSAFRVAEENGHLEVLKWLKETFNITDDEAKSYNYEEIMSKDIKINNEGIWPRIGIVIPQSLIQEWIDFTKNWLLGYVATIKDFKKWNKIVEESNVNLEEADAWIMFKNPQGIEDVPNKILIYIDKIGHGSYGEIFAVNDYGLGERIVKIAVNDDYFHTEEYIMRLIKRNIIDRKVCPNFLTLYDSWTLNGLPPEVGKWDTNFYNKGSFGYLLMEKANGGEITNLESKVPINKNSLKCIIYQLLYTLLSLHKQNIQHRDIQHHNILLNFNTTHPNILYQYNDNLVDAHTLQGKNNATIKMIDFGVSRFNAPIRYEISTPKGAIPFRPPEFFFYFDNRNIEYTYESDIWSIGILIATIANNFDNPLYDYQNYKPKFKSLKLFNTDLITKICKSEDFKYYNFVCYDIHLVPDIIWGMVKIFGLPTNDDWPEIESTEIYKSLLEQQNYLKIHLPLEVLKSPSEAPFWSSPSLHKYLDKDGINLLKGLLQWNPKNRISLDLALQNTYFKALYYKAKKLKHMDIYTLYTF